MIQRFVIRERKKRKTPTASLFVIKRLLMTEKSNIATSRGQYAFSVSRDANKFQIADAVQRLFNVEVKSVQTLNVCSKARRFRGVQGRIASWKKAYVTLKEGQVIDVEAKV